MKLKLIAVGLLLAFSASTHAAMSVESQLKCRHFGGIFEELCGGGGGGGNYQAEHDGRNSYGHEERKAAQEARDHRYEREIENSQEHVDAVTEDGGTNEAEDTAECLRNKGRKNGIDC